MSVRFAILGLLAERPRPPYELWAAFQALAGGPEVWDLKPPQVYTTLERLAEAGLVEAVGTPADPDRRVYRLTPRGRAALEDWFYTGIPADYQRDEFFVKLMLGLLVEGTDLHRLIQAQRAAFYQQLHKFTRQRAAADPQQELARILFLDKVVMHLEAELRWLDLVEARLDEIRRQPPPRPQLRPRGRPARARSDQLDGPPASITVEEDVPCP